MYFREGLKQIVGNIEDQIRTNFPAMNSESLTYSYSPSYQDAVVGNQGKQKDCMSFRTCRLLHVFFWHCSTNTNQCFVSIC